MCTLVIKEMRLKNKPLIRKLGTIDCDMVETTPVVFRNKLFLFEYVRNNYKPNTTGSSYFRFIDIGSHTPTAPFAQGYHLGSAFVEEETVYVYGVGLWGDSKIYGFRSTDLDRWSSNILLDLPRWGIYNTSVCKAGNRYVMAIELGEPPEEVGVRFTIRFAESPDLSQWRLTPSECVYSKDRYTACPAIRFLEGYYYMIYLEAMQGPRYEPYIVRSRDLVHWEGSIFNPVMTPSADDKLIANPRLTVQQRNGIASAVNLNNSDLDLCEFGGKTKIYYSWGNQQGIEFLAEATYDGPLRDFLTAFFPD